MAGAWPARFAPRALCHTHCEGFFRIGSLIQLARKIAPPSLHELTCARKIAQPNLREPTCTRMFRTAKLARANLHEKAHAAKLARANLHEKASAAKPVRANQGEEARARHARTKVKLVNFFRQRGGTEPALRKCRPAEVGVADVEALARLLLMSKSRQKTVKAGPFHIGHRLILRSDIVRHVAHGGHLYVCLS